MTHDGLLSCMLAPIATPLEHVDVPSFEAPNATSNSPREPSVIENKRPVRSRQRHRRAPLVRPLQPVRRARAVRACPSCSFSPSGHGASFPYSGRHRPDPSAPVLRRRYPPVNARRSGDRRQRPAQQLLLRYTMGPCALRSAMRDIDDWLVRCSPPYAVGFSNMTVAQAAPIPAAVRQENGSPKANTPTTALAA
jgi:hypothetical protein